MCLSGDLSEHLVESVRLKRAASNGTEYSVHTYFFSYFSHRSCFNANCVLLLVVFCLTVFAIESFSILLSNQIDQIVQMENQRSKSKCERLFVILCIRERFER